MSERYNEDKMVTDLVQRITGMLLWIKPHIRLKVIEELVRKGVHHV